MKIVSYALCALTAVSVFASCSKEDGSRGTDATRSVAVRINSRTAKAVDDPITGTVNSAYSSLYIYFTDGTKVVSSDVISKQADVDEFKSNGKNYDNISSSITKVMIVANVKTGDVLPVAAGTAVADVKSFAFAVASQQPDAAHAENTKAQGLQVTMMGEAALTDTGEVSAAGDKKMKAAITISPIVARMEISKALVAGDGVYSIKIDNVYLNAYYSDYSFAADSFVDSGVDIANYDTNLQNDTYGDEVQAGTKADVYHLFADGTATGMPHIILGVSGYFKNSADGQGEAFTDRYLTITKFKDSTSASAIGKISANNIYRIDLGELTVPASVLDPTPEAGRISLDVSVDVAAWNVVNVSPEL